MVWSEADLAYLAGLIDGEGCIALNKSGARNVCGTQLFIGNTDARMVHWLREHFGGTIQVRRRTAATHKPLYMWSAGAKNSAVVLAAVRPYLKLKREQAEILLDYRQTVSPVGANQPLTPNLIAHRLALKSRLSVLNRRGA